MKVVHILPIQSCTYSASSPAVRALAWQIMRMESLFTGMVYARFTRMCSSVVDHLYVLIMKTSFSVNRFPFGEPNRLNCWISFAQRDRWSINSRSAICSRHFTQDCFELSGDSLYLKPDAVPSLESSACTQEVHFILKSIYLNI